MTNRDKEIKLDCKTGVQSLNFFFQNKKKNVFGLC